MEKRQIESLKKELQDTMDKHKAEEDELSSLKKVKRRTGTSGLEFNDYVRLMKREIEALDDKIELLETVMTLSYENARLSEKIAQSEEKWEKQRTTLNVKIGVLEKEKKKLLMKQFLDLQKDLWEIQSCEAYGKLFDRLANPIQILLGLAEDVDAMTDEIRDYYMWDVIIEQSVRALEYSGGEFRDGKFLLPSACQEVFDRIKKEEEARGMSFKQLDDAIKYDINRKEDGGITLRKAKIIQEFAVIIEQLKKLQEVRKEEGFDWKQPVNKELPGLFAEMTKRILESHKVYPMFESDGRLEKHPGLREGFRPCNEYSIRYPGFFIQKGESWVVLGEYTGMDRETV